MSCSWLRSSWLATGGRAGGEVHGLADALIGAAATDIRHGVIDIVVARIGIFHEQRSRSHDLARLAIAALRNVDGSPRLLHGMHRSVLRQTFDGGDLLALDRAHRHRARTHRNAVDVHRARAALRDAAAVFRAGETDVLADHPQEWRVTFHLHVVRRPIDVELGHELPPFAHSIASAADFAYVSSTDRNLP